MGKKKQLKKNKIKINEKNFNFIIFFFFFFSFLKAEIVKKIIINGNKRVSDETIKIYGEIEINKDYYRKRFK